MIEEVKEPLIPLGGTLGDLIELLPSAGLGFVTAMQDAVVSASSLYDMKLQS
ncbi:hypothetical protein BGZ96_010975 [Linnemannia gamsii]|uniref:Uncharacterized protein n=1 Tax=Linnemannia gamsii TaxID=64522 RepID=A0ABQ7JTJ7_9FUNG|nr:hypothetical protein BGZ96_010975 [Linnemannia gamsii]